MSILGGPMQRGFLAFIQHIHLDASLQQPLDSLDLALPCSVVEGARVIQVRVSGCEVDTCGGGALHQWNIVVFRAQEKISESVAQDSCVLHDGNLLRQQTTCILVNLTNGTVAAGAVEPFCNDGHPARPACSPVEW